MPSMANLVWQSLVTQQKSSAKGLNNTIPQMPGKFVDRSFLVGGFVGSKSQAGSSPSRAHISLNDVIFEQLLNLGLNLYNDIISHANCEPDKMISERVSVQNFNWRCNSMNTTNSTMNGRSANNSSYHFNQISGRKKSNNCKNTKNNKTQVPITKHCQEELVYEDKDEGGNSIYVYQEVQKSTCEVTKTSMFHVRSRTISDCSLESDDSFIIFESTDDTDNDVIIADEDEDEDDEESDTLENYEYEDNSSDDSNDCSEVDYLANIVECQSFGDTSTRLKAANSKWNEFYCNNTDEEKSTKKVKFANENQLTHVRVMVTWDFAHRSARKGPWERLALDTCRFRNKILQLENIINPILMDSHRKYIYKQRFESL